MSGATPNLDAALKTVEDGARIQPPSLAMARMVDAARRELSALVACREALVKIHAAVSTATHLYADPKWKPWERQHAHDFLDGIASEIDAALARAAKEGT